MLINSWYSSRCVRIEKKRHLNQQKKILKFLPINIKRIMKLKILLCNLATKQDRDPRIVQTKQQALNIKFKMRCNILFRLMNHYWKIVLSGEILNALIIPCSESLVHNLPPKHYLVLRDDCWVKNMFRRIKDVFKKMLSLLDIETTKSTYICLYGELLHQKGDIFISFGFFGPIPKFNRGVK